MKKIYELKHVTKVYNNYSGNTIALDRISLDLNEKEIITILGPSGSGKSTLLNILSGIDNKVKGDIFFYGNRLNDLSDEKLTDYRKDNLGFIFQSYNLISNLTIYENIELGYHLSNTGLDIDEILDIVGLKDHKYKFPYQLSGGQMQRVAIARAIAKNPKVLFCDEPTGALDENMGKETLKLMQDINKKYGTTIIIVTHNPSIANMSNTVIKVNSGKIVEKYNNDNVLSAYDIRWA